MKTILIAAMTLCGRISPTPLGSTADRALLTRMRDETDASLIGATTLAQENPQLRGNSPRPRWRGIITASGQLPLAGKDLFNHNPPPIIFTTQTSRTRLLNSHGHQATVIALPSQNNVLDLHAALAILAEKGVQSVLIEGGGQLNFSALHQGIVDEVMVTITPQISGNNQEASLASGLLPPGMKPPFRLELLHCTTNESGEIFTHYKVIK